MAGAHQEIEKLWRLQRLDKSLQVLESSLAHPSHRDKYDELEQTAKLSLKALRAEERAESQLKSEVRRRELDLASVEEEIKTSEGKLYGGEITNSKELKAIEQKLDSSRNKRETLEDELLQMLEMAEQHESDVERNRAQAKADVRAFKVAEGDLEQEISTLQKELDELGERRQAMTETIDDWWLDLYSRLQEGRGFDVVALVSESLCSGCRVSLPENSVRQAAKSDQPQYCDNCGRLLFVP